MWYIIYRLKMLVREDRGQCCLLNHAPKKGEKGNFLHYRKSYGLYMLIKPTTAVLEQLYDRCSDLRRSILSTSHEPSSDDIYYISPSGDNSNDGRSPTTAWKTLDALEGYSFKKGAEVLFERGGIWRGKFKAQSGVTYSSYGSGEKPIICGSPLDGAKVGHWREVLPGIWRYSRKLCDDVGGMVFNNGSAHAIKVTQRFLSDGNIVDNVTGEPFKGFEDLHEDLSFFHDIGHGKVSNEDGGRIYLRSDEDPAKRFFRIEFLTRGNIIQICGDDVTVDDIAVMYGGSHGIGSGTVKNLTVKNCVIGWIGGSLQFYRDGRPTRFGNGVEIYGGCEHYRVLHNYIYQIYDAGATHQLSTGGTNDCIMSDVEYSDNLIEYCTYSIEYFLGKPENDAVRFMSDIRIKNNILRSAGFGWGHQRPDKNAASHIKSWDSLNKASDFVIEGNDIIFSRYMMIHCGAEDESSLPAVFSNTFLQYNGEFGRYGKSPTELKMYNSEITSDHRLFGNEFYILNEE